MHTDLPFVAKIVRKATSSAAFTSKLPPLDAGDVFILDAVSVMIDGHKTKYVDVGFISGSTVHLIETVAVSANNVAFVCYPILYVPSSYRVFLRFQSPTIGVIYTVDVFGRIRCFE